MEKRRFGKTDMDVSILGFGGAEIGFQGASLKTVEQLLTQALDEGLNVIDTAECYQGSEELIGTAVGNRRADFHLFTKCGHGNRYDIQEWDADQITQSVDRSLKRLNTDYLDLIQLHSCDENILRRGEVIEALQKVRQAGKSRYIGYSGDGAAAMYAITSGAFDSLQTSISIADQQALETTVPAAVKMGMGVIAKRPLANAAWRSPSKPSDPYIQPYWERLQKLKYDFINGNAEYSAEIALRFALSVPGVSVAIVGTTKPGRWADNAKLVRKGSLSAAEFDAIRARWQSVALPEWTGQV